MKGLHRRHARAGRIAEQNAVFYMTAEHAAGLQYAQQVRAQVVHLLEKFLRVRIVPEIIVAGRVFIVIAKGNAGDDLVDGIIRHARQLVYAVVMDGDKVFTGYYPAFNADGALHVVESRVAV